MGRRIKRVGKNRTARHKPRLILAQRTLIAHIFLLALALAFGLLRQAWPVAILMSSLVTLWTVRRLLLHRTLLVILTRALEPLLIVGIAIAYVVLLEDIFQTSLAVRSVVLAIAMIWQVRFLLVQFDPNRSVDQSLHSLFSVVFVHTIAGLWLIQVPELLWLVMLLVWVAQYVLAHFWLERLGFHNSFVASIWALVSVELVWVSSFAITVYNPVQPWGVLLTRSSLMILVLAYAWGFMLQLHSRRRLSKALVLEYGMMCTIALIALLVMPI
ncbi:hypothetical protein IT415_00010 [bacterium]|nr:hypothetical protein [bacterium]